MIGVVMLFIGIFLLGFALGMDFEVWHNTNGNANQYFVTKGTTVLFQIPNWLGRLIKGE